MDRVEGVKGQQLDLNADASGSSIPTVKERICANQILNFPLFALAVLYFFLKKERKGHCSAQFYESINFSFFSFSVTAGECV